MPLLQALKHWRRDWILAAGLATLGTLDVALRPNLDPHLVSIPAAVAGGLAVGLRRAAPLWSALAFMALLAGQSAAGIPVAEGLVFLVELVIVVFSVGAFLPIGGALAGLAATLAAVWASVATGGTDTVAEDLVFSAIIASTPWLAGRAYRNRQRRAEEMERRAAQLEVTREADMRAALEEERSRIARELHDVIAHTVSVMGVQASGAAQVLDTDTRRARDSLHAIEASAREAVFELRRLLDVLRQRADAAALSPQPGLEQLDALVEDVRKTGLEVELHRSGSDERLSPGVELAAYRIVQEALTNVVKHARASSVRVAVRQDARWVELDVADDGIDRPPEQAAVGHGLIGMRERVALYGGSLEAGPRRDGGWRVVARLADQGRPS